MALLGLLHQTAATTTSGADAAVDTPMMTPTPTKLETTTRPTSSTGPVTVAPIYLPYYDQHTWSAFRGSIIGSDEAHNKTTYTIFCPTTSADACNLALNFPFVIVEGPKTVEFHGTYTSTLIIDIECKMDHDPAAATCSGYSSLKSGYSMGNATGPTSGSWTSTFTGTAAEWANLTLTTSPTSTGDSTESSNDATSGLSSTALLYIPEETGESSASSYGDGLKLTAMAVAVSIGSLLL